MSHISIDSSFFFFFKSILLLVHECHFGIKSFESWITGQLCPQLSSCMPSQRTWHEETFQRGNFHRTSDTIQIAGILPEETLSWIVISKCLRVVFINDKTRLKLTIFWCRWRWNYDGMDWRHWVDKFMSTRNMSKVRCPTKFVAHRTWGKWWRALLVRELGSCSMNMKNSSMSTFEK